jgi:histidyl-tRNA synthetase
VDKVLEELLELGISTEGVKNVGDIFSFKGDNYQKLDAIAGVVGESVTGMRGVSEMRTLLDYHSISGTRNPLFIDITLARGLNYYTGTIFEVTAADVSIGSVCGGGRYDDLTGIFGMPGLSGVGISFGADRIYDVMQELNLFMQVMPNRPQVLMINFGEEDERYSLQALDALRSAGVAAELYPDVSKIKKQMTYADARKIPYVVLAGEQEREAGCYTLKNMLTGEQQRVTVEELIAAAVR